MATRFWSSSKWLGFFDQHVHILIIIQQPKSSFLCWKNNIKKNVDIKNDQPQFNRHLNGHDFLVD
jgi:hypothetical protein